MARLVSRNRSHLDNEDTYALCSELMIVAGTLSKGFV